MVAVPGIALLRCGRRREVDPHEGFRQTRVEDARAAF